MRLIVLRGIKTCHCENSYDCDYDFGCSSEYHTTVENVDNLPTAMETSTRDVGELLTLIARLRDLSLGGEVKYFEEAVEEFLGCAAQYGSDKVLFQDFGEELVLALPLIENNRPEWQTHPDQVVRQLIA